MIIDILKHELDNKLPHWLSPLEKLDRTAIRLKHRRAWAAKRAKPVSPETRARGQAEYERIRAKDPTYRPPDVVLVLDIPEDNILPEGPTNVADIPVKLQLVAWAKAIMVLDASEIMVRDLIERDLAGHTGQPVNVLHGMKAIPIVNRLVDKIEIIRRDAIKTAFRLLRSRLGDVKVLDRSLAVWAQAFAKNDLETIRTAITTSLIDGLDNTEIARKVVGTMGLNGVDGVTEFTRHKIAHLGRASIKAYNLRKAGILIPS